MKRALGLALAGALLQSAAVAAQTDVPAPWSDDETITISNGAAPGVVVMSSEDFCRSMAFLLLLYREGLGPSDEQVAGCARVISEQMATQAWVPEAWQPLIDASAAELEATSSAPEQQAAGPMTMDEAGAYYLAATRRHNLQGAQWGCAAERSENGLSWKQDQRWSKRMVQAQRKWMRALRAVTWPKSVQKKVDRLLDETATTILWDKRAYNHKSYTESVLSGDWGQMRKAGTKSSDAAQRVRSALGTPSVPTNASDCQQVKRLEKLLSG